jgi:hypothetical protein
LNDAGERPTSKRAGHASWLLRVLALVAVIAFLGLVAFLGGVIANQWRGFGGGTTEVLRTGPAVVTAIRDMARLETSSYHMERVIELKQTQKRLLGHLEVEDRVLLVAAADVTAGVDLSALTDGDVQVDAEHRRVRLRLPAPIVLSARLDNERTHVANRDTDLLARRDEALEGKARREAEATLRQAALDAGILDHARAGAERTLGALLRSLGYDDVGFDWR